MAFPRNGLTSAAPADTRLKLKIARKWTSAEGIVAIDLTAPDGAPLPAFTAGSHIDLFLPGGFTRQYSLRNDPRERHRYAIGVLREPGGRGGSAYVHDRLNVGDLIDTSRPRNAFELDETAPFSLLLAGGIGVTPILAMAYRLSSLGQDFEFHYCARSADRLAFRDEIEASAFAGKVRFHLDDGPEVQRLSLDRLLAYRPAGAHLYACGPSGFLDAVMSKAKTGWSADAVHREYFAKSAPKPQADQPFRITLASTGRRRRPAATGPVSNFRRSDALSLPAMTFLLPGKASPANSASSSGCRGQRGLRCGGSCRLSASHLAFCRPANMPSTSPASRPA
jgi:vanillate O-demethylase ferredoxin subunit